MDTKISNYKKKKLIQLEKYLDRSLKIISTLDNVNNLSGGAAADEIMDNALKRAASRIETLEANTTVSDDYIITKKQLAKIQKWIVQSKELMEKLSKLSKLEEMHSSKHNLIPQSVEKSMEIKPGFPDTNVDISEYIEKFKAQKQASSDLSSNPEKEPDIDIDEEADEDADEAAEPVANTEPVVDVDEEIDEDAESFANTEPVADTEPVENTQVMQLEDELEKLNTQLREKAEESLLVEEEYEKAVENKVKGEEKSKISNKRDRVNSEYDKINKKVKSINNQLETLKSSSSKVKYQRWGWWS